MTPYGNFTFFILLALTLIPAIVFGFLGVSGRIRTGWLLLTTLFMLWVIYRPISVLVQVGCFFFGEYILIRAFLAFKQSGKGKDAKILQRIYILTVLASIFPLALVKLSPIFQATGLWLTPLGFLGISYLTFRTTGTVIEIRDGLIKQINILDFFLYVLFFPTLASGPIDRYRRFLGDLENPASGEEYSRFLSEGIHLIFRGLLYKFIFAYLINKYALVPLGGESGFMATFKYMYAYSFYLFFDFAGYSAFAIGTGYLLGIKVPPNFNKPFLAKNIKDFWNRWHMSLSFWFRDYIYMRFVLDSAKKKRFKNRYTSAYLGYLLLFGIMGIWHGTQLQYITYGLYHAAMMIGYDWLERKNKKKHFWGEGRAWDVLAIAITAHFVFFGFLIFSGRIIR